MHENLRFEERILTGISLGESHFREFKSAYLREKARGPQKRPVKDIGRNIGEVLVSFANADGGELYVGVEDDGTITGIPHSENEIDVMRKAYLTYVHADTPLPPPLVKLVEIRGERVLYFQISQSGSGVHLTSEGRCLQRFDRENRPVSPEQISHSRQEAKSLEYDRQFIPKASVQDLDIGLIESIAQQIAPGYSAEKLLQFLGLAEYNTSGLRLRRAALLLFGKKIIHWHPRCEIRILRVDGTEVGTGYDYNIIQDDTITDNIVSIVENAWDILRPYLARTRFQPNALFKESIIYPEEACRETVINAVAHRDYSIEGKPIEIFVFDDRLEVHSPGGLLSSISVSDLKELKGVHQSRNVFISRVLRELGYMREMGEGIRRIFNSVRDFDLVDPDIRSDANSFTVTLYHKSIFSPKDVQWLNGFAEFDLTKDEQRVTLLGRNGRLISTNDIIELLKIVDTEEFRALYERLNLKGLIFSAKKVKVQRKRRMVPRFQIRPPREAQQFLAELLSAVAEIGPVDKLDRKVAQQIREHLSENSPYYKGPVRSLRALGYVGELYTPLPKLRRMWKQNILHAKASEDKKQSVKEKAKVKAKIITLFRERGFGFAQDDDGNEYYIHIYEFEDRSEWKNIQIGTWIKFYIGERMISGKPRPAKSIVVVK